MSTEADRYSETAIDASQPLDPEVGHDDWARRQRTLHRLIFRAGAHAGLDHQFNGLGDESLARLEWLAGRGVFTTDLLALVAEVRDRREKDNALTSTYGMTDSDLESMVAEGFHTAFRKRVDSPEAVVIHKLIRDMDSEDWGAVVTFVAGPIIRWLREAQTQAQAEAGPEVASDGH